MNEWYLDEESKQLTRLCITEKERAQVALHIALHTEQDTLLYHDASYGIPYTTIYEDSFDLAKLKLSEGIKSSLPTQNLGSIAIIKDRKNVNVEVEIVSKTEGSSTVISAIKMI